jgi:hypothetical protein
MAIVQITTGITLDEYRREQAILAEIGEKFPGRLLQVCYGDEDNLRIITLYESKEARDEFRNAVLAPVLQQLGIAGDVAKRANYRNEVAQVHKVIVDTDQYQETESGQVAQEQMLEAARRFIDAINGRDTDGLLSIFSDGDVRFVDAGREFTDIGAIRDFSDRELIGVNGNFTMSRVERSPDVFSVFGHYRSDRYNGSVRFDFVLDGEKLLEVNVAPA